MKWLVIRCTVGGIKRRKKKMEHRLRLSKNVVVVTESIDEAAKFLYRNMELKLGVKKDMRDLDDERITPPFI